MTERAATEPPVTFWGWVGQVIVLAIAVTVTVAGGVVIWALHWRDVHAVVDHADCSSVRFVSGDRSWTYAPDDCHAFRVGDRWLIQVNDIGSLRPRRRE